MPCCCYCCYRIQHNVKIEILVEDCCRYYTERPASTQAAGDVAAADSHARARNARCTTTANNSRGSLPYYACTSVDIVFMPDPTVRPSDRPSVRPSDQRLQKTDRQSARIREFAVSPARSSRRRTIVWNSTPQVSNLPNYFAFNSSLSTLVR